mmetsp:Transcript_37531/g.110934  ORF Transcript_37531/g.110934 Transcript_37531/m.110934 type:complete len:202 (+) Transcript_37531:117-722(+)
MAVQRAQHQSLQRFLAVHTTATTVFSQCAWLAGSALLHGPRHCHHYFSHCSWPPARTAFSLCSHDWLATSTRTTLCKVKRCHLKYDHMVQIPVAQMVRKRHQQGAPWQYYVHAAAATRCPAMHISLAARSTRQRQGGRAATVLHCSPVFSCRCRSPLPCFAAPLSSARPPPAAPLLPFAPAVASPCRRTAGNPRTAALLRR